MLVLITGLLNGLLIHHALALTLVGLKLKKKILVLNPVSHNLTCLYSVWYKPWKIPKQLNEVKTTKYISLLFIHINKRINSVSRRRRSQLCLVLNSIRVSHFFGATKLKGVQNDWSKINLFQFYWIHIKDTQKHQLLV